jgi:hypothetical protein
MGNRKAVNAQNDSAGEFFRSLFSPALPALPKPGEKSGSEPTLSSANRSALQSK